MELLEGKTLAQTMTHQPMEIDNLLPLAIQIADALESAHAKGIVHRDIKPANIMIADDGSAKITDFGVAKIVSQQMTQAGAMMGTPSYMSPEQIMGEPVDGRADQFGLALIAYEVLTGEKPFTGYNTATLIYRICREDPAPARRLNPTLGPEVDRVLQRALAKVPDQRYATCSEFVADLQKALAAIPSWKPLPRGTSLNMDTIAGAGANRAVAPVPGPPARPAESESHLIRNTVLAAIAFVGWIGYLAYLAFILPKPVIVSRSQVMGAYVVIKGEISIDESGHPKPAVKVLESFGPRAIEGEKMNVDNLSDARLPDGKPISSSGTYLLILKRTHLVQFEVVRAPAGREGNPRAPVVYAWNDGVERQVRELTAKQ